MLARVTRKEWNSGLCWPLAASYPPAGYILNEHTALHTTVCQESEMHGTRGCTMIFKVLPLVTYFCHLDPIS